MSDGGQRRIAVIGGGPIGLAAAAHLVDRGATPVVLEAGESVGAHVLAWGHVQVFSPWRYNVDPVAGACSRVRLDRARPRRAADRCGDRRGVSSPLAALPQLAPHLRLDTRVVAVARAGCDKMKTIGRDRAPFVLRVRSADGRGGRCWRGP